MRVTVNEESKEKEFPKLMISDYTETLVYMIERKVGIPLNDKSLSIKKGELHKTWNMDLFKDFNGTVTLSKRLELNL